jgi:DNA-binding NtrC family response regulator
MLGVIPIRWPMAQPLLDDVCESKPFSGVRMNADRHDDSLSESFPLNGCKVLIVDDEADFLDTLIKRLRRRRIDVRAAGDAQQALALLESDPVDVIVLDVRMPKMDGIRLLERIKQRYARIEVIMLTGHASMEAAVEGMALGAFDYLMKPVDIDELIYKVQDAYKKRLLRTQKKPEIESSRGEK